jgi:hypothetical protein
VTASNVAGEGTYQTQGIWLGEVPSEPLNPLLLEVVPESTLTLEWDAPLTDGCLTILSYTIAKDGSDHVTDIDPSLISYTDAITTGGSIGDLITY